MANKSIYNAFERMWQHVVAALGDKSDRAHNHLNATTTSSGFMSAEDKKKLDGISSGSNGANGAGGVDITIDSVLSESSTNPVQNKVVTKAIADANEHADDSAAAAETAAKSYADGIKTEANGYTDTSIEALGIASGTWTPYFADSNGNKIADGSSGTFGYYSKVGDVVTLIFSLILSEAESSALGSNQAVRIAGVPSNYPPAANVSGGGSCAAAGLSGEDVSFNGYLLTASNSLISPKRLNPGGGIADVAFGELETMCYGTITYKIKST